MKKKRGPGRAEGLVPAPAPEGEEFCLSGPVTQESPAVLVEGLVLAFRCVLVTHVALPLVPIDSHFP